VDVAGVKGQWTQGGGSWG